MDKIVGIGEYIISNVPGDFIKTFALASCVAVTVYNAFIPLSGMIHIALPNPVDIEQAKRRPGYYATSGIPLLVHKLCREYGSQRGDLQVKLFGGAVSLKTDDYFKIGLKNIKAVRETLLDMNLKITEAQIGGAISRSITMNVLSGKIEITALPINF
ncbi:putative chemoreceptor glutamine deamidase CheD [Candidatus Desulfosporosinus infrequens]|uniref:Probable chemoreceptor glutamine deamidase CheD n=1 Tax=Candidatus Desulfosporosinus infrequens TaxID=2043169 RepID=A0A2U3LBL8_9FIRM|nr:putative chemoreceptor glutamine deamidase CheD [Candidatus Desulfosporosinus infrequens]